MGGFSASVQQDLNNTPPPPPNAVMGNMGRDTLQAFAGKGGSNNSVGQTLPQQAIPRPNQVAQPIPESVAQPAVMPPGGGGKGSVGQTPPNTVNPQPAPYTPFRDDTNYAPPDGTRGGKGSSTNSATSGQPRMGQPNNYANTIPQWDNASQQLAPAQRSGKGKGG